MKIKLDFIGKEVCLIPEVPYEHIWLGIDDLQNMIKQIKKGEE